MTASKLKPLAAAFVLLACLASAASAAERAIVLPLQPAPGSCYDGTGPALQNIIENVLALHPDIEETYLLRHIKEVFADAGELQDFMQGRLSPARPLAGAVRQGARYVFFGAVQPGLCAEVSVLDAMTGKTLAAVVPIDPQNGLTGLRAGVLELMAAVAGPMPPEQARRAHTADSLSLSAMKAFGLSYGGYMTDSYMPGGTRIGLDAARRAATESPKSYLAANMLGWQLFASGETMQATLHFRQALAVDPFGVDALDGMMQSAFRLSGTEQARPWALRKARARGGDTGPVLASLELMSGHRALEARDLGRAIRRFRTAQALDPLSEVAAFNLAMALEAAGQHAEAQKPLDERLAKPCNPAMRALLLNFKARVARWTAVDFHKAGKAQEARQSLDQAVGFLKQSPLPDLHEYSLTLRTLAEMAMEDGDGAAAVALLEYVQPEPRTDPILVEAMLARARAQAARMDEAKRTAWSCLLQAAERDRTIEPVPIVFWRHLATALDILGENALAQAARNRAATGPTRAGLMNAPEAPQGT